jgi:hypothetical protein
MVHSIQVPATRSARYRLIERIAPNGARVKRRERAVPRVVDAILNATVYLYATAAAAKTGDEAFGGSGVLIGQPCPDGSGNTALYVVTCDHVATLGAPVVRVVTSTGAVEVVGPEWVPHPDGAPDVVVAAFGIVTELDPRYNWIPLSMFAQPADLDPLPEIHRESEDQPYYWGAMIGAGDDTVLVGRFLAQDGVLSKTPTVRFGNIASAGPAEIEFKDPRRPSKQQCFLVESRSLPGYSGSAVYMFHSRSTAGGLERPIGHKDDHDLVRFLGIDCAHMNQKIGTDGKPLPGWEPAMAIPGRPRTSANAGMMTVVPAWKIAEVLQTNEIMDWTKEQCRDDGVVELDKQP